MEEIPQNKEKTSILSIVRDTAIILALTFLGGFVIGIGNPSDQEQALVAVGISNLIFSIVGFIIVGCLTTRNRCGTF